MVATPLVSCCYISMFFTVIHFTENIPFADQCLLVTLLCLLVL